MDWNNQTFYEMLKKNIEIWSIRKLFVLNQFSLFLQISYMYFQTWLESGHHHAQNHPLTVLMALFHQDFISAIDFWFSSILCDIWTNEVSICSIYSFWERVTYACSRVYCLTLMASAPESATATVTSVANFILWFFCFVLKN